MIVVVLGLSDPKTPRPTILACVSASSGGIIDLLTSSISTTCSRTQTTGSNTP